MAPLSADVKGTFASAAIVVLSCLMPLPSDSHLRVADNYDVWAIQMRALAGAPAYRVMTGATLRSAADGVGAHVSRGVGPAEQLRCCFHH